MEKPIKPIEPNAGDIKHEGDKRPTATYDSPYILDYRKYKKDLTKYKLDLETYEQKKLIKFVKAADEKLILKKYTITKK